MDLEGWMRSLGLEQYEPAFRKNKIDGSVLQGLTNEDLKDLGVELVGDRRRLLDAIAALRAAKASPPEAAPPNCDGKITFISDDDGYSPPKTVEMTRKLVESDQVPFIAGGVGAPPTARSGTT